MFSRIVSSLTGGTVGGASGASLLTGLGVVVGGPVVAAIGFGAGAIAGTTAGAITGNKLAKKIEDNK